ncbi:MAG TPA: hypothetical protein EYP17_06310 [Candidatus Latescibacteria bacterium]|nr:hypothetical protein [Candidatus Latescibacterota bacterium]
MEKSKYSFTGLLDPDGRVTGMYGIRGTPTAYLIDREGMIIGRKVGYRDWATDGARSLIAQLLEEEEEAVVADSYDGAAEKLLPASGEIEGWRIRGEVMEYVGTGLFDYLDGGAELYYTYDFRAVATAEYENPAQGLSVVVDVYDMAGPEGAFGIYSLGRRSDAQFVEVGHEAILTEFTLDMWKGRFFVRVQAFKPSEGTQQALMAFARHIAAKVAEKGETPSLLKRLPAESRVSGSERFFRGSLALNNIRYLPGENILRLDRGTKGVSAEYLIGSERATAFLIEYPSEAQGRRALEGYSRYLREEGGQVEAVELGDGAFSAKSGKALWTVVALKGRFLAGVWDAGGLEPAVRTVGRMLALVP